MLAVVLMAAAAAVATETWTEIRSPNFRVITNGSEKQGREVAASFERLATVLQQVAKIWPIRTVTSAGCSRRGRTPASC